LSQEYFDGTIGREIVRPLGKILVGKDARVPMEIERDTFGKN